MTGDLSAAGRASQVNLPNALTVLRLLLVPLFVWLFFGETTTARWLALLVFCGASLTDFLDGHLARRHHLETDFGRLADPLADKALTLSAFVLLSISNPFVSWLWLFTVLVAIREVGITVIREVLRRRGTIVSASAGGKLKTVLQIGLIIIMLIPWETFIGPGDLFTVVTWVVGILAAVTLAQTLYSGAQYLIAVWGASHAD